MKTESREYTSLLKRKYLPGRKIYLHRYIYPIISQYLVEGLTVDLGCGFGEFLKYLYNNSRKCIGVDSNPCHVDLCKSLGFEVYIGNITSYILNEDCDNVVLDNVVEHLQISEIYDLFCRIQQYIKRGGHVLIIVPCERGYLADPTHVTYVDDSLIEKICHKFNYRLIDSRLLPFDIRWLGKFLYLQMNVYVIEA